MILIQVFDVHSITDTTNVCAETDSSEHPEKALCTRVCVIVIGHLGYLITHRHTYKYMQPCTWTHTHTQIHAAMHMDAHTYTDTRTRAHIYKNMHAHP